MPGGIGINGKKKKKQDNGDHDGDGGMGVQFSTAGLRKVSEKGTREMGRRWGNEPSNYIWEKSDPDRGTANAKPPTQESFIHSKSPGVPGVGMGVRGTQWMTKVLGGGIPEGGQKDYIEPFRPQQVF